MAPIIRRPRKPLSPLRAAAAVSAAAILALAGCSKPVEKKAELRPVRAVVLAADNVDVMAEFPGEVRARVESRLGFRIAGKIVTRKVDVGTEVKRGQLLMQLDPQDLKLAQAQANAGLKAAESNRDLAKAELKRYQDLREKNFVSQAILDSKETAFKAAQASYDQAVAAYRNQSNQAGYASLVSDVDGVVTGVDAEVGQVVGAGAPVLRVAQAGEKEIVIAIPEDKVDVLRKVTDVKVRTWANPNEVIPGTLRELSPVADPATRTYAAKIAIPDASARNIKLGMTGYATFSAKSQNAMLKLPLTALFNDKGATSVWVVENGSVKLVPVQVGGSSGNEILVAGGLSPGQTVVTAGVNQLKAGQQVKILAAESTAKPDNAVAAEIPKASAVAATAGDAK